MKIIKFRLEMALQRLKVATNVVRSLNLDARLRFDPFHVISAQCGGEQQYLGLKSSLTTVKHAWHQKNASAARNAILVVLQ